MKFYRIDWPDSEPTAQTTDWATSRRVADRIARESGSPDARIREVEIPLTKAGMLAFLKAELWCDAARAIARAQS